MYRFALRPVWLLSHVLVLALVVAMVSLGLWQLRRLDERRETNATIRSRSEEPVEPIDALVAIDDPVTVGEDLAHRDTEAAGTYRPEDSVYVRSRSLNGRPGFWVLTPLVTEGGAGLVVNRGWIPFEVETDGSDIDVPTPEGEVRVAGIIQSSVSPAKPGGDDQPTIAHADLDHLRGEVDYPLYPVFVQLEAQDPSQPGEVPVVLDPPAIDEGRHFGYAMQWFIFGAIALIGYPMILRRVARQKQAEARAASSETPDDEPQGERVPSRVGD